MESVPETGMEIVVPSVMHSGTHLLRYQILQAHFKDDEDTCLFNGNSGNVMHKFHVDQWYDHRRELENFPVYAPLRHPRRIAASWMKRQGGRPRRPYTIGYLEEQLEIMQEVIDTYNPLYLHVDHPVRDIEVDLIGRSLWLPIKACWDVCKRSGSVTGLHNIPIKDCPQINKKYIDFYYETVERVAYVGQKERKG